MDTGNGHPPASLLKRLLLQAACSSFPARGGSLCSPALTAIAAQADVPGPGAVLEAESSEWKAPRAGCGHPQGACVCPGFQCPLLSVNPVTVSDPRKGKLRCGGGEDVQLFFSLKNLHSLLGFPLLKHKHTFETLLEVVRHNQDLQGSFFGGSPTPASPSKAQPFLPSSSMCPSLRQL